MAGVGANAVVRKKKIVLFFTILRFIARPHIDTAFSFVYTVMDFTKSPSVFCVSARVSAIPAHLKRMALPPE